MATCATPEYAQQHTVTDDEYRNDTPYLLYPLEPQPPLLHPHPPPTRHVWNFVRCAPGRRMIIGPKACDNRSWCVGVFFHPRYTLHTHDSGHAFVCHSAGSGVRHAMCVVVHACAHTPAHCANTLWSKTQDKNDTSKRALCVTNLCGRLTHGWRAGAPCRSNAQRHAHLTLRARRHVGFCPCHRTRGAVPVVICLAAPGVRRAWILPFWRSLMLIPMTRENQADLKADAVEHLTMCWQGLGRRAQLCGRSARSNLKAP